MICYDCMKETQDGSAYCMHCGREVRADAAPHHLKPGTVLHGQYLVGNAIGEGGFGITYVGRDLTLDMKIAVKEFYPSGFANRNNTVSNKVTMNFSREGESFKTAREQVLREARSIAKFHNIPGIVDVRACFEENNTAYIIMEYLDGMNLSEKIERDGKMPAEQVFRQFIPMMRALKHIHRETIIHRDISPDNIRVLSDGTLKLMDFGSARYFSGMEKRPMSVQYKPGYAPSEQYSSEGNQGPWTDVYALCATMYKCITGVTPVDSLTRYTNDTLLPPSALGADISKPLENVLLYGMAIYPEHRCKSMDELIEITETALQNNNARLRNADNSGVEEKRRRTKAADEEHKTVIADQTYGDGEMYDHNGAEQQRREAVPPQKQRSPLIPVIIGAAVAVLAAVGVLLFVLLYTGGDNKDSTETTAVTEEVTTEAPTEKEKEEEKDADTGVAMPDVTGKKLEDAANQLGNLGLKVETEDEESTDVPEGYIIRQSVGEGRELNKGDSVMLTVAKAPENRTSLSYEQSSQAQQATYFLNPTASSVLADQQGHNYAPSNVLAYDSTCWVEGAAGLGIGEWIQLELPEAQQLNGLRIVNGYAGSEKQYTYNSKVTRLQIEFSDGQSTIADLEVFSPSNRKTVQVVSFSHPVVTEYVRLTILDAQAGDCSDTCLTYVAPY
ncbi:MAG: PASTA domain-containing protein [Ruminococcus sp.]|nr:PASTA domain-containing protein [Ruminococcus sp.]